MKNKFTNILNFFKIIFKNNKKRIFSLFIIYLILNSIFILLAFLSTSFYEYININKKYSLELSLKNDFINTKDKIKKDFFYKDYLEIKDILGNDGIVNKNYFLKYPTYGKLDFFQKNFETDLFFHVYDFDYLGIKIKNKEKINLVFSTKALVFLENFILSNLNYENIVKFLDGEILFGKNSFIEKKEIIKKDFVISNFSDKLAVYSMVIDEKQLKKILDTDFFNNKIKLHEITIKFKNKEILLKYKKILLDKGYKFSLKNKEFEKENKRLNSFFYYFFIPSFSIILLLLTIIFNLNLENSILKNKDIILNLKYLKINNIFISLIFYLEFFIIFILSILLLGFIYGTIFISKELCDFSLFTYFNQNSFLNVILYGYIIIFIFYFININFKIKKIRI